MTVVKLSKKDKLDQLVAKITLQTGNKPTLQEIVDLCIDLGEEHIDELIARITAGPSLDKAKVARILQLREKLASAPWSEPTPEDFPSKDDADIYSV